LIQERYRRGFYFRDRPLTPYVLEFARLPRVCNLEEALSRRKSQLVLIIINSQLDFMKKEYKHAFSSKWSIKFCSACELLVFLYTL